MRIYIKSFIYVFFSSFSDGKENKQKLLGYQIEENRYLF